ncbi:MAG: hypothetical protein J1E16_02970 [Muribaculaceae bacterium]|nr:hypothetical protein [Muribaculaceae bacterium]
MNLTQKLSGLGALAVALFGLYSCTNEISDTYTQVEGLRLAKAPDITAWSGETFLTPASRTDLLPGSPFATRAEGDNANADSPLDKDGSVKLWDYYDEDHEHEDWYDKLNIPTESEIINLGAVDITKEGFDTDAEIYYIPSNFEGNLNLNYKIEFNENKIYIYGKVYGFSQINCSGASYFYIAKDAVLNPFNINSGEGHHIYNNGTLVVTEWANIDHLYNSNDLTLGSTDGQSVNMLAKNCIYSLTDVKLPAGSNSFKATTDIHGVLISGKDIKIENDFPQYVCGLKVDGNLDLTKGKLHTSYLNAKNITFDGSEIWLMPMGYIKANKIELKNSNTYIHGNVESFGYVNVNDYYFRNKNDFVSSFSKNIYYNVGGSIDIEEIIKQPSGQTDNKTNFYNTLTEYLESTNGSKIIDRFKSTLNGKGECSEIYGDPDLIPCPKCGHDEHGYLEGGNCPDCDEAQNGECYNSSSDEEKDKCPNKDEDVEGSGCDHDKSDHNPDGTCKKCVEDNADTECNPCPKESDKCEHSKAHHDKDGYCDECTDENNPCHKPNNGGNNNNTPNIPTGITQTEVEVNLSINDEHVDKQGNGINDLVAKLSIHVRLDGDVEVFIPIPKENYVANDDIVILNTHAKGEFIHGGPTQVQWDVDDTTVKLTLSYEEGGIRITTDGIDENVYNYCKETYGDGINFEVWLYTNSKSDLKFDTFHDILDSSTVEFLDKYPDYYINAFNDTDANPQGMKDCDVNIIRDQESQFPTHETDMHLNGSEFNVIWKNKDFNGPDGEHDHEFLWKYGRYNGNPTNK